MDQKQQITSIWTQKCVSNFRVFPMLCLELSLRKFILHIGVFAKSLRERNALFFILNKKVLSEKSKKQLKTDADPSLWNPCVVVAMDKFTPTTEILWRKRDGTATLSREEYADPCLGRLLLLFWAHYIEDGPHLLCTGLLWVVTFNRKQRRGCS